MGGAEIYLWAFVLAVGLVAIPFAYAGRLGNRRRLNAVLSIAGVYLMIQICLFAWILGALRYSNPDWIHALIFPFAVGLALPVLMGLALLGTRAK
jgi:hypothetical protein